jgi:hypothetical protein
MLRFPKLYRVIVSMHKAIIFGASLGAALWGFQAGLNAVVDTAKFEQAVRDATRGRPLTYPAALVGRAAVEKFKALSPEARAAVTTEALQTAKALITTPVFAQAHEQYLKTQHNAVNHGGMKTDVMKKIEADPEAGMKDIMAVAAVQMAESLRKLDSAPLKMMLDLDMQQESDAKLKSIAPLLNSNFEEFRRQYSLWKAAKMGGPSTETAYQATLVKAGVMNSQQSQAEQQRRWDEHNLNSVLQRGLDHFIATAASVDFSAQTRQDGRFIRFVNPAYERKSADWKLLYRVGQPSVQAALAFARAWRKEL